MLVSFIDFAKAYEMVDREKLWFCLQSMGVNSRFLRFLQALYDRNVCRVKVNGHISEEFEVHRGLRQRCVLSPLLFSLQQCCQEAERGEVWCWSVGMRLSLPCYLQMTPVGSIRYAWHKEEFRGIGAVV